MCGVGLHDCLAHTLCVIEHVRVTVGASLFRKGAFPPVTRINACCGLVCRGISLLYRDLPL